MRVFRDLVESFYSPSYYAAQVGRSISSALLPLFVACVLGAVVALGSVAIEAYSALYEDFEASEITAFYPAELVVHIAGGAASANVEQPYFVYAPPEEGEATTTPLFIIDTRDTLSVAELDTYKAPLILTKGAVRISNMEDESRVFPLENFGSVTIHRAAVDGWVEAVLSFVRVAFWPFMVLGLVGLSIFSLVFYMVVNLAGAFVVSVIAAVRGRTLLYGEAYTVGLAALVVVELLSTLEWAVEAFWGTFVMSGWMWVLVFCIVVFINCGLAGLATKTETK